MKRKQTRDFLIRNIPLEIFNLLEESAKEHNRSKTQEAIVALATGLSIYTNRVRQPKPFKWREKISNQFIERAIDEGRV
jgi:TraY domain-containing protein